MEVKKLLRKLLLKVDYNFIVILLFFNKILNFLYKYQSKFKFKFFFKNGRGRGIGMGRGRVG